MKRREDAALAFLRGGAAPLGRIVARVSPRPSSGHKEVTSRARIMCTRTTNAVPVDLHSATLASRSFEHGARH